MRAIPGSRFVTQTLLAATLVLCGGCGLLGVEMTSSPESVRKGDPVTFDIKLTNYSSCPLDTSAAILVAFLPLKEFDFGLFLRIDDPNVEIPPEIVEFLEELSRFFDVLCTGGTPEIPILPPLATSCRLGDGDLLCEATGPAPAHEGEGGGSMTFATPGDRLRCEIDEATMRCQLRFPLPQGTADAAGTAAAANQPLTCLSAAELGDPVLVGEAEAVCFLGTFPDLEGLGPNQMGTGQVTLPARGAGAVRNLVFAIGPDEDDAGVCKGGANAGQACDRSSSEDCPTSSCGEGICVGGDFPGRGCDVSTQATDCPNGGMCKQCDDVPDVAFLPLDCTTTFISPETAPAMSPWGLVALAAILLAGGTLWLRRRARV
jgi:hypothetical protein